MLFSDPTGSGMESPPQVLVQGTADVDDRDLDANRDRYRREMRREAPRGQGPDAAQALRWTLTWYLARIYIHVRPERIYVWADRASAPSRSCSTRTWRRCARATTRSR